MRFVPRSLRARLIVATVLVLIPIILASTFAISFLFEEHVERLIVAELEDHMSGLIRAVEVTPDGTMRVGQTQLPKQFAEPFSGFYWQIDDATGPIYTSPSLSDFELTLPLVETSGHLEYVVSGPRGEELIVVTGRAPGETAMSKQGYRFAVGEAHDEVSRAVLEFAWELGFVLAALAITFPLILWVQISYGLRPVRRLRDSVLAIRAGKINLIEENYVEETASLVEQLHGLLMDKEDSIERSRRRAVGLAHALKTPLTMIRTEARKLAEKDEKALADRLDEQVQIMSRRMDRELIRTKFRGRRPGAAAVSTVRPVVQGIIETLRRLPEDGPVEWAVEIPEDLVVPMAADDLTEVLGNLLDNCRKWTHAKVRIASDRQPGSIELCVEDDGPGVPQSELSGLLAGHHRPPGPTRGSGLGLAIAQDIVSEYGGSLHCYRPSLGGFGIGLRLPIEEGTAPPR